MATLDMCSFLLVENSSPYTRDILLSTASRTTLHPSLYRGGRAGEARLEFLSFDGMGGGVQAHNQNTPTV